jgi:hypothetical protein
MDHFGVLSCVYACVAYLLYIMELQGKYCFCRVFFPHDLDSAADALLAGDNSS